MYRNYYLSTLLLSQGTSCSFYHGVNRIKSHDLLGQCGGLQGAWDIEDLVRVGHKVKACPYFAARSLLNSADLVICPYNYLVDPIVRESVSSIITSHVAFFQYLILIFSLFYIFTKKNSISKKDIVYTSSLVMQWSSLIFQFRLLVFLYNILHVQFYKNGVSCVDLNLECM